VSRRPNRKAVAARTALKTAGILVLAGTLTGVLLSGPTGDRIAGVAAVWQALPAAGRALGGLLFGLGIAGLSGLLVTAGIVLATLITGRWYCSVLCPLGILQDLVSAAGRKRRKPYRPVRFLRAGALAAFLLLASLGALSLASWLDPWSLFSRFAARDLQPLLRLILREDLPGFSLIAAALPAAALLLILAVALFRNRWFCGNLCPAGTLLGLLNSRALLRVRLDSSTCLSCGACANVCPAGCIETASGYLDSRRCVQCLACLTVSCPVDALRYGPDRAVRAGSLPVPALPEPSPEESWNRRLTRGEFFGIAAGGIISLAVLGLTPPLPAAESLPAGDGRLPVLPPGAGFREKFLRTCVACGLCVSRCPSRIIQPARGELGARGFMTPRLDYSISYCQYDCTACMDVCPAGALEKRSLEEKHYTKIGDASLVRSECIVFTNGTKCGACAEHCPTGAVRMETGETGLPEPVFNSDICIGCGACHHACPVEDKLAISVSGLEVQTVAEKPSPTLFDTVPESENPGGGPEEEFPF